VANVPVASTLNLGNVCVAVWQKHLCDEIVGDVAKEMSN
jgi:hypothetical protein